MILLVGSTFVHWDKFSIYLYTAYSNPSSILTGIIIQVFHFFFLCTVLSPHHPSPYPSPYPSLPPFTQKCLTVVTTLLNSLFTTLFLLALYPPHQQNSHLHNYPFAAARHAVIIQVSIHSYFDTSHIPQFPMSHCYNTTTSAHYTNPLQRVKHSHHIHPRFTLPLCARFHSPA